jgi:hypothetical protein
MLNRICRLSVVASIGLFSMIGSAHAGVWTYQGLGGVATITSDQYATNNGLYHAVTVDGITGEVMIRAQSGPGPFYQGQSSYIKRRIERTLVYAYDDTGDLVNVPNPLHISVTGTFWSSAGIGAMSTYNSAGASANVAVDMPVTGHHVIAGGGASAGYFTTSDSMSDTLSTTFTVPGIPSLHIFNFKVATYADAQGNRMIAGSHSYGAVASASVSVSHY